MKTKPNSLPWMTPGRLPSLSKLRKLRRPKATSRSLRRLPSILFQMWRQLATNPRPLTRWVAQQQIIQSVSWRDQTHLRPGRSNCLKRQQSQTPSLSSPQTAAFLETRIRKNVKICLLAQWRAQTHKLPVWWVQTTFFDRIFTSLPLCKALVKLEKTNERPKSRSKAELLQLGKEDLCIWNDTLEPNYVKYYLSTKTLWSVDVKLLEVAQLLYDETLGSKKPLLLTLSSGPIKLVTHSFHFLRMLLIFS